MKDTNSLSHTSYRCKYHIVSIPKYRRMVIYGKLRRDIIEIIENNNRKKTRNRINRRRSMYRSHTYVSRNTTKVIQWQSL